MRWLGLSFLFALAGCYAIPAEHNLPNPESDAGSDGGSGDTDAEPNEDAEVQGEDASKLDARVDAASLDAAKDAAVEATVDSANPQDGTTTSDGAPVDAGPCGKTCADPTRVCSSTLKMCVACTASDLGSCKANEQCSSENKCVECLKNEHCTNADASVCDPSNKCVPCSDGTDTQCAHISGKNVCAGTQCVQCTKDKRTACKTGDNKPAACDNALHSCTTAEVGATGLCGECVSDAQCQPGSRCVQTTYMGVSGEQVVGWHCMWRVQGGNGAPIDCALEANRPFVGTKMVGSIDAPTSVLATCTLRASTCPAYLRYSKPCGRYTRGGSSFIVVSMNDSQIPAADQGTNAKQYIHADDGECGGVGSKCLEQNASTAAYKCSTGCANATDCKSGFSCVAGPPDWCSVN